ncbi:ATPase [Halobacteriales archaeon QS_3_64_16]|nr:MAG: ATPase [Halobacteriales archaeon QS_3_64_16]
MNILPDTSAVVDGRLSEGVEDGTFAGARVYVPEAVVAELEGQANNGQQSGWDGLEELQRLASYFDNGEIEELEYVGRRPGSSERHASHVGEIDALIRDLAGEYDATLLTSDGVQAEVARAKNLTVEYREACEREVGELGIEQFFDEGTMSIHLKTGVEPMAKRGSVGEMRFERIGEEVLSEEDLGEWIEGIERAARESSEGFFELEEPGMDIVQLGEYRIAIARPPFADGLEITAVRPIARTTMADYDYAEELQERLLARQRGVLISGAPGAGKSTFAQAVAEFLVEGDYSVKTMEKPRDLQVGPEVTQYTELGGSMANTADSLLMVRPDYTIYDEVRKTEDFGVFSDMRLAGVGMVGVVHATRAIDALQRLIGRVELGIIPQVVDTVVYIEAGRIDTVYDVTTQVKVPEGLMEEDLARPVITIRDFATDEPAYEIYTFNNQVVTVPMGGEESESGVSRIARQEVEREIRSIARGHVDVEIQGSNRAVVYVEDSEISGVIGKGGGRISDVEDRLGIEIDVRTHEENSAGGAGSGSGGGGSAGGSGGAGGGGGAGGAGEVVTPEITSRHVVIGLDGHAGETVEVQADGEYLFTATVSRGDEIQVSRGSAIAEELEQAIDRSRQITVVPS